MAKRSHESADYKLGSQLNKEKIDPYLFNYILGMGQVQGSYYLNQELTKIFPSVLQTTEDEFRPWEWAKKTNHEVKSAGFVHDQWQVEEEKGDENSPHYDAAEKNWSESPSQYWLDFITDGGACSVLSIVIGRQRYNYLLAESQELAHSFFRTVVEFFLRPEGAIMVFSQGRWLHDEKLYEEVKKHNKSSVILEEDLLPKIYGDIERFFKNEEIYKQYGVAWKRGVIFAGPAGNGKCVAFNDFITLANGHRVLAGSLIGQDFELLTLKNNKIIPTKAHAEYNDTEEVFELETNFGRKVIRNGNHPFWTTTKIPRHNGKDGYKWNPTGQQWTPLKDISIGQYVAVPTIMPTVPAWETPLLDDEVKILAYLIGDGGIKRSVIFSQCINAQLNEFIHSANNLGCSVRKMSDSNKSYDYAVTGKNGINPIRQLLKNHGLFGKGSDDKFIPDVIFTLPINQQADFLSRLFSTDGWACVKSPTRLRSGGMRKLGAPEIGYGSNSERLLLDIQELLLRFGICSRIHRRNAKALSLFICSARDIIEFTNRIGIFGKEDACQSVRNCALSQKTSSSDWRTREIPESLRWEKIKKISSKGISKTVAIEVPETNTFLTTFWEHNTETIKTLIGELPYPALYVKSFNAAQFPSDYIIRSIFSRARETAPCILVLEDLDALVNNKNRSTFLNELDGFDENRGILTLATTNHLDRLDAAIAKRPSRFDRIYIFDKPGEAGRHAYLLLWNDKMGGKIKDMMAVVAATADYSYAALKEVCMSALVLSLDDDRPFDELLLGQIKELDFNDEEENKVVDKTDGSLIQQLIDMDISDEEHWDEEFNDEVEDRILEMGSSGFTSI